jgi:hypothetical protein
MKEFDSKELIKILIVRAHDENQKQLCETMKQTLRAMHFECNFPETIKIYQQPYNPQEKRESPQQKYKEKYNQNGENFENTKTEKQNDDLNYKQYVPKPRFGSRNQNIY